ncbi:MAG TPA: DUF58 domain-containing protein, partial [Acidimicrobiales bacterium]|nr:DUF58 domain-containing protein [Acidimicrobiales bacterium]
MSFDLPGRLVTAERPSRLPRRLAWADLRRRDPLVSVALALFALAVLGWAISAIPLAIAGMLGACTTAALQLWQVHCLSGVSFRRQVSESRVGFGEEVSLELEIVNDKVLPLSWLQLEENVPANLPIEGATVVRGGRNPWSATLVQIRPFLPYQRVRRRFSVRCVRRGEHVFGPGELTSGDPVGLRRRRAAAPGSARLLVYPKNFAMEPERVVSRVLVGEQRARRELLEDPSRSAGVRPYRPGDPLRRVNWRASARTSGLLVREFDPTVSLRVALFVDLAVPRRGHQALTPPQLEFTIAVAASLAVELDRIGVPTGLYVA